MVESLFPSLKAWAEDFVQNYGYTALFILSFSESVIQPIPPYPFIASASLFGLSPYTAGFVAFVGNLLGAVVAYFLARILGENVVKKIFREKLYLKGEALFNRYGFFAVLIGEPYKLFCWLSGIFKMPFWNFLLASVIARATRIGAFALFGDLVGKIFH